MKPQTVGQTCNAAESGTLGTWYSPEEVSKPGVYIREGSETLVVMEIGPVRHYPEGGGKPFYKDTKILDGSTAQQDWGSARLFGPISFQALLNAALPHPAGVVVPREMSNDELAKAIEAAFTKCSSFGSAYPYYQATLDHYKALLKEQERRAISEREAG